MRRGGAVNLNEIQSNLENIQTQVNQALQEVKNAQSTSSTSSEPSDDFYGLESSMSKPEENISPSTTSTSDFMSDYMNEPSVAPVTETSVMETPSVSVPKPWQDNKDLKFNDGTGGRVSLSFPRIMTLLDKNIKLGNTTKNWSSIKNDLLAATSTDEVKSIIKSNALSFSSNSVYGGTRKKRKARRRKTKRRY